MANDQTVFDENGRAIMRGLAPNGDIKNLRFTQNGGMYTSLSEALGAAQGDSILSYDKPFVAVKLAASGLAWPNPCAVLGFIVESSSSGTVALYDNAAASGDRPSGHIGGAVAAGDQKLLTRPVQFINAVYALITGSATIYVLVRDL